jgi:glycosyltransferase involved in cell wall biosynthesis
MRILHVIHGLPRGGLENGVVNLINHLPREEFEQAVSCLDQRGDMADLITHPIDIFELGRRRHDLVLPFRLAKLIRYWRPDVIHCRNWNTWFDSAVANLLAGRHSKLVWSFHGFADGDNFPRRRRVASRFLASITNHLFAVCRDSATRYAQMACIAPERLEVIYNGVDCERFQPAKNKNAVRMQLGIPHEAVTVLTVASRRPRHWPGDGA